MKKKVFTVLITLLLISAVFLLFGCDNFSLFDILANGIYLVPEEITLNTNEIIKFEVSGGIAPFIFTEDGVGVVPDGIYTALAVPSSSTISVEDDRNRTAEAYVTVVDAIFITPEVVSTGIWGIISFTINGGAVPYSIELDSGLGTLTYNPGIDEYYFEFAAGAISGQEVIRITDDQTQMKEVIVTILDSPDLMIIPEITEVKLGEKIQFSASGGTGAYTYTHFSGDGTFVESTRIYTAPLALGVPTSIIRVDDGVTQKDATIFIVAELLTINPSIALTLYVGDEFTFSASNGNPQYSFSILGDDPSGSIDSETGLFTALAKDNSVTVIVTDSNGNTSTCRVKIKS